MSGSNIRVLIYALGASIAVWSTSIGASADSTTIGGPVASNAIYSDPIRTSQYVTVRDGTRLAIDIYRPKGREKAVETPYPVILVASFFPARDRDTFNALEPELERVMMEVLKHGYVFANLETRGHGASFGSMSPSRIETPEDYWDLYDVIEWLAVQPWSDGKIGMAGCSNEGETQFRAAAALPPHLKAIMPGSPPIDWATLGSVNGITSSAFSNWLEDLSTAIPVDGDKDERLKEGALLEHKLGGREGLNRPFRDDPISLPGLHVLPTQWWNYLPNLEQSRIPIFQYSGWRDVFPEQTLALYRSLAKAGVPQKLVIGPWYHCGWYRSHLNDAAADAVRWFDYWLKGIPDGIMDSAPIRYYVVGAPAGQEWKTATQWPLPNAKPRIYFLSSENALTFQRSKRTDSNDRYTVRYRLTSERLALRFTMGQTGEVEPGLTPIVTSELDANSVSYSSPPLEKDAQLTGFPVITLWATSTAKDQDFFVYLEDVDPTGRSTLLTDGALRASNRAIQTPSFDNEGLPWHGGNKFDRVDLQPEAPAELRWALFPLSNYVKKGHRLRISINSFDQDAWDSPKIEPAPTVTLLHDQSHPSSITLPFVQ